MFYSLPGFFKLNPLVKPIYTLRRRCVLAYRFNAIRPAEVHSYEDAAIGLHRVMLLAFLEAQPADKRTLRYVLVLSKEHLSPE